MATKAVRTVLGIAAGVIAMLAAAVLLPLTIATELKRHIDFNL